MTLVVRTFTFAIVLFLCGCGQAATGADNSWIVGKWELAQDPDGDEQDWLEFTQDGKAFSVSPNGRRVPGTYIISGENISIVYTFKGRQIPINLSASTDKAALNAYSKNTGNTSVYRKAPELP